MAWNGVSELSISTGRYSTQCRCNVIPVVRGSGVEGVGVEGAGVGGTGVGAGSRHRRVRCRRRVLLRIKRRLIAK